MKKIYLFATMAAMLASCSSDDSTIAELQKPTQQPSATEVPIAFDSYIDRTTTRAGLTGAIKLTELQTTGTAPATGVGFGVFGYYTNADNYDQTFTPNFMYNQQVYWDGTNNLWDYKPIKYWPNEFGTGAASDDVDKVSFFAYAPYVSVNVESGKVKDNHTNTYAADDGENTMGIVGMKNNNTTGDPMIKYISTFYTDKQVDLLWGTAPGGAGSTWDLKNTGSQTLNSGKAWLDIQHPSKTSTDWTNAQKVKFNFKHGLAALNVKVDTKVDGFAEVDPAANTKVFIRSVVFEGFDTKGALNLNNGDPGVAYWYNFDCESELNNGGETTIKDGRKDGKEGLTAATKEYAAINPTFVQSTVWDATEAKAGVTKTPKNLFATYNDGVHFDAPTDEAAPIYVIPNGDKLKVTIEYDVLTKDGNLAGKLNDGVTAGSVVKNVITRYITANQVGSTSAGEIILENGKVYTVCLHLGMNSVQFDAAVTAWPAAETSGAALPHNN